MTPIPQLTKFQVKILGLLYKSKNPLDIRIGQTPSVYFEHNKHLTKLWRLGLLARTQFFIYSITQAGKDHYDSLMDR